MLNRPSSQIGRAGFALSVSPLRSRFLCRERYFFTRRRSSCAKVAFTTETQRTQRKPGAGRTFTPDLRSQVSNTSRRCFSATYRHRMTWTWACGIETQSGSFVFSRFPLRELLRGLRGSVVSGHVFSSRRSFPVSTARSPLTAPTRFFLHKPEQEAWRERNRAHNSNFPGRRFRKPRRTSCISLNTGS